jgi:LysM repeat protein
MTDGVDLCATCGRTAERVTILMQNDHPRSSRRTRPAPSDIAQPEHPDLTAQFWGGAAEWTDRPRRNGRSRDVSNQLPAVRALRDGLAAFRPQRRTGAVDIDRTREHGIVRPAAAQDARPPQRARRPGDARVPVARNEATLGELAAGRVDFDGPIPHRPAWARRDDAADAPTARVAEVRRPAAPALPPVPVSFDEIDEIDEYDYDAAGYADGGRPGEPDVWTDLEVEPGARRWAERVGLGAVDPLIARLGALLLVTALVVPLALSMRGGSERQLALSTPAAVASTGATASAATRPEPTPAPAATPSATPGTAATATVAAAVESPTDDVAAADTAAESQVAATAADPGVVVTQDESDDTTDDATGASIDGYAQSATVGEPAERATCGADYTIVAGDSWYRIADAAAVEPGELLAVNQASIDATLLPGDVICLPEGAQTPAPPSTAATTTAAPTSSAAPATTTATTTATTAPSTTSAPTTTSAPPESVVIVSVEQAQQIIRDVWPDDLEERALEIAYRESNWRAGADNGWCCVGLFQIYWTVHQSWLDDYGITTREHLKDARKNAEAAYALYIRAGGWSPWSTA